MKKLFISILILALLLGGATSVIAATYKSPAEIYAGLKGTTVEEAYMERVATNYSFGQLAASADLLDEFQSERLENMKTFLQEKITKGELTQEQADAILERMKTKQALCQSGNFGFGMNYGCPANRQNNNTQDSYSYQGRGMRFGGFCGGRSF